MTNPPSPKLLNQIADRLSRPIPPPRKSPPKPAASWRTLKPGQLLTPITDMFLRGRRMPSGEVWRVEGVDSGGCWLTAISEKGKLPPQSVRWTLVEWKEHWKKVPKRRGRKDG